jgi:hypothetical protein
MHSDQRTPHLKVCAAQENLSSGKPGLISKSTRLPTGTFPSRRSLDPLLDSGCLSPVVLALTEAQSGKLRRWFYTDSVAGAVVNPVVFPSCCPPTFFAEELPAGASKFNFTATARSASRFSEESTVGTLIFVFFHISDAQRTAFNPGTDTFGFRIGFGSVTGLK